MDACLLRELMGRNSMKSVKKSHQIFVKFNLYWFQCLMSDSFVLFLLFMMIVDHVVTLYLYPSVDKIFTAMTFQKDQIQAC